MNFLKKNIFLVSGAIIVLIIAVLFQWQINQTKKEVKKIGEDLNNKLSALYRDLDSKLESAENNLLKLKEKGYVEADEFSDISQRISNSTVLVVASSDVPKLNQVGSAFTAKEADFKKGLASGFFVRQDGYIITAKHTADSIGHDNIFVFDSSGKQYKARITNLDEVYDLALIKIDGAGFPAVPIGYFDNLQVGDEIGFVGYSFNAQIAKPLVYRGVVSAKGIDIKGAKAFSINAFVNKGNSGGPVFSAKTGRVIGMVSARQRDVSTNRYISLPPNYQSGLALGGIDPLKLNIDLYNRTVDLVSDVSQVGIGIVFSLDRVEELIK